MKYLLITLFYWELMFYQLHIYSIVQICYSKQNLEYSPKEYCWWRKSWFDRWFITLLILAKSYNVVTVNIWCCLIFIHPYCLFHTSLINITQHYLQMFPYWLLYFITWKTDQKHNSFLIIAQNSSIAIATIK